jgi:phosphoribosylformimino-5-aminoimidazole carboxamide ribotide isomerase
MDIIPAIDLKGGKCVRLYQGDYKKETVFSEDPISVAVKWQSMGAKRLHIVDLDGAKSGYPENLHMAELIYTRVRMPIQFGGGIRDENTAARVLKTGIDRVIIGTVAIEKPDLIKTLCDKYGDSVLVSIDARNGFVSTRGWLRDTEVKATDLALQMKESGVRRIMFTDIKRDGTLTEPAYDSITELIKTAGIPVIAAGGISRFGDLKKLARIGAEGAILGRAIYTGDIDLKEALSLFQDKKLGDSNVEIR